MEHLVKTQIFVIFTRSKILQNKLFENKTFNFKNDKTSSLVFSFSKNALLTELFGVDDKNLIVIEKELKVKIRYKGNTVIVYGERDKQYLSKKVLEIAYNQLLEGQNIEFRDIRGILNVVMSNKPYKSFLKTCQGLNVCWNVQLFTFIMVS